MEQSKIEVTLLPHTPFLKYDGKFDKKTALEYSAKLAGECYEPEGWEKLKNEPERKTISRENRTLGAEHATPYEHVNIGFEINNLPKILAMVLNNERQCSTSEKSARYTEINSEIDPNITLLEGNLYHKWMEIFELKIKQKYGNKFPNSKITKLAQENSRYLVTVFASTKMIHTVPLVQINRIASFMEEYKKKENKTEFDERLIPYFDQFINAFDELGVIDERAMSNRKHRTLSLFDDSTVEEHFGTAYSTNYKGSWAQLAQAHRHRTIEYGMHMLDEKEYFVPPILKDDPLLVEEWLTDMEAVSQYNPQGELVSINEVGKWDKFILKTKERLCTHAQLEIMLQTRETLLKYKFALAKDCHELAPVMELYSKGARCTFPDYDCAQDCGFAEGKTLKRII